MRLISLRIFVVSACLLIFTDIAPAATLPFIQTHGTQFVDASGNPVVLKGCNLGNWLLIELWMFGGCIQTSDQAHLFAKLDQRFGADRAKQLMDVYRQNWITPRDFDLIRSFGFNVVRLPIDYRLLQSDEAPYGIKPDGFKWIDRAVDMAQTSGIYIILDLHAAPGGQSNDQYTGQSGQNKLWNNPVNQERTADVWRAIATRYRDRSNVAGYDLMNEPYADHHMDVRADLKKIMGECYTAIRETGDKHVMFFPGALGTSPEFYGDPHTLGYINVGFTEHFYPGLFGDKTAFESHIRTLTKTLPAREKWLDRVQSPYYIGEFNPVLDSTGGPRVTRAYYDAFAQHGWAGTLWSFKLIKPNGGASSNTWYCVSNADSLPKLNLDSSSYEDFEKFFTSLATIQLSPNQPVLTALTRHEPANLPLTNATDSAPAGEATLAKSSLTDAGSQNSLTDNWNIAGGFKHSSNAVMEFSPEQTSRREASEIWQDVPVVPGKRYHLSLSAVRNKSDDAGNPAKIELRLQGELDGLTVTLNSTTVGVSELGSSDKPTQLTVNGTAISDTLRVRIIVTGASQQGSGIKFNNAVLQVVSNGK